MSSANIGKATAIEPKIIQREKKMVDAMVIIYCKDHHDYSDVLCPKCFELGVYAKNRLENCPYQEKKPVCGICDLKCYNPQHKDYAEIIFNYSGPRMMFQHPRLALHHLLDAFRNNDQLRK
jgi:hypothetical protein